MPVCKNGVCVQKEEERTLMWNDGNTHSSVSHVSIVRSVLMMYVISIRLWPALTAYRAALVAAQ